MKNQFSIQELKWLEVLVQKDIAESRELMDTGTEDAAKYASILELRIANMEGLEIKIQANIARLVQAQKKAKRLEKS